jgi:hypothetical protein
MFDEWRERRELRKKITSLRKKEAKFRAKMDGSFADDSDESKPETIPISVSYKLSSSVIQLDKLESERLLRKANSLGIEFPKASDWWWEDDDAGKFSPDGETWEGKYYLTDIGKAGVSKLIREERRKNVEWWVKIITPILSAIIALLGLIVALVSVSKK